MGGLGEHGKALLALHPDPFNAVYCITNPQLSVRVFIGQGLASKCEQEVSSLTHPARRAETRAERALAQQPQRLGLGRDALIKLIYLDHGRHAGLSYIIYYSVRLWFILTSPREE
jgi:hypothetical protein